jgi:Protein of unknown function (DUF2892)
LHYLMFGRRSNAYFNNLNTSDMNIDRVVLVIASCFVLASVLLSIYHNQNWLWFTGFVGANLFQAAFTGFCPLAKILKAVGVEPGHAFK